MYEVSKLSWLIERAIKVDLRIVTEDIPRQEIITRDNISILANAVVYFAVHRPSDAVIKISNYTYAVRQYTQAALRDVVGNMELDSVLTEREKIATDIRNIVDAETNDWGIDIKSIKIQDIELPADMKRVPIADHYQYYQSIFGFTWRSLHTCPNPW